MENKEQSHHPSKNALRLGCCALVTLILATEKVEDFLALKKAMQDAYDTPTEWEADMLHHAIETAWFHIRAAKAYAQLEAKLYQTTPNPADWTENQHRNLARFLRYKTKHAHDVNAYLKQLEAYKRSRRSEVREARISAVKQAKVQLKNEQPESRQTKTDKLAMLDVLSKQGLVRWQDLEGVLINGIKTRI